MPSSHLYRSLLPIDGLIYETMYGTFIASVLNPPTLKSHPYEILKVEVEFRAEFQGMIRKMRLVVSAFDLARDRLGIICRVNEWVSGEPSEETYFEFDYYYDNQLRRTAVHNGARKVCTSG